MNSDDDSRMQNPISSGSTQTLLIWVEYRIPSLNVVFKKTHWWRVAEKKRAQAALAIALRLRAAESGSLTRIT